MRTIAPIITVLILAIFLAPALGVAGIPYALPAVALFWLLVGVPLAARRLHERGDPKIVQKVLILAAAGIALVVYAAVRSHGD